MLGPLHSLCHAHATDGKSNMHQSKPGSAVCAKRPESNAVHLIGGSVLGWELPYTQLVHFRRPKVIWHRVILLKLCMACRLTRG